MSEKQSRAPEENFKADPFLSPGVLMIKSLLCSERQEAQELTVLAKEMGCKVDTNMTSGY